MKIGKECFKHCNLLSNAWGIVIYSVLVPGFVYDISGGMIGSHV